MAFVELFCRSNFSFLHGASDPEDLIEQAQALGYPTLGLCDLDGLYGMGRAFQQAENLGFSFKVGAELNLQDASSVGLLCLNKIGYTNLCRLITRGKMQAPKGASFLKLEDILTFHEGLLCLAAPPFDEPQILLLKETFQDRLYLALHRHRDWESERHTHHGLSLSGKLGVEAFATNRPCMHKPQQKKVLDVLHCIRKGITLQQAGRELLVNAECYLKSEKQMLRLWKDHPELVLKTFEISQRCAFSLHEIRYQYPQEAVPEGETSQGFLKKLVVLGAEKRFPQGVPQPVWDQIYRELDLIFELKFEDYFLTIWDIINFAKTQKILFQGRGSAANSMVCYVLEITAVDPVKADLLFERFISKERGEPPDIDVDFEHERREEVIQYIYKKYGHTHAAMVCNVICFRSRMAVRETAKVFGVPLATINQIIKWMGHDGMARLGTPECLQKLLEWNISPSLFQQILDCALELKGFPRHLGIHSGGFVISQLPLMESVPVEKATMEGRYVVQWNKDDLEALGLLKIDVLGLGMLTCIKKSLDLLKKHKNVDLTLATTPLEDSKTFEMVGRADTVGVFQIESRAQMTMLPRLRPQCFYDYVVQVAIVRPGPLQGGMVHPYLRRRQKRESVDYAHPALEPILKRTLGVPIFQEQVMKMAVVVAGFTPGESDELRRVMSSTWRKGERMDKLKKRLLSGMAQFGITDEYAQRIYKTIEGFGSYGFPESHAASFALLTAVSCYLKCHYPDVFACALLNSQPLGFYAPRTLIEDAKRHGVGIKDLDINLSQWDYTLEGSEDLRLGFRAVFGVVEKEIQKLLLARTNPYVSVSEVIRKSTLKRSTLLRLAAAGAFQSFGLSTRQALWQILKAPRLQSEYGDDFDLQVQEVSPIKTFSSMNSWEQVQQDYKALGFSPLIHPLQALRPHLNPKLQTSKLQTSRFCRVAGLVSVRQRPPTAKGIVFLTLEDEFGFINVVIKPDVYQIYRQVVVNEPLLEVEGSLICRDGVCQLEARRVFPIQVQGLQTEKSETPALQQSRDFY